jgi:PrpF protein
MREFFSDAALVISPYILVLENLTGEYSLARFEPGTSNPEFGNLAVNGLEPLLFFAALANTQGDAVLANTGHRFSNGQGQGAMRVTMHTKPIALLPTGNVIDLLDCGPKDGLQISVVDAGEPIIVVRAESIGANAREALGARCRFSRIDWNAFDAQVARLCGFDLALALQPLVWVANAPRGSDAALRMDCSVRSSLDRAKVTTLSGKARMSLISAAAIPGSVLQQMVRALPGVDARLGLDQEVVVACAEVQMRKDAQWCLHSLSMQQQVERVLEAQFAPPPAKN